MKISTLSVALILSLAFAAPAASVEIVYITRAIGTGTIDGKSFTNDLVTLEAVGDTDVAPSSGTFQTYTIPVGVDAVGSMGRSHRRRQDSQRLCVCESDLRSPGGPVF